MTEDDPDGVPVDEADADRIQLIKLDRWLARKEAMRDDPGRTRVRNVQILCECRIPIGVTSRISRIHYATICQTCHYLIDTRRVRP